MMEYEQSNKGGAIITIEIRKQIVAVVGDKYANRPHLYLVSSFIL
jgi:hypothetical protein